MRRVTTVPLQEFRHKDQQVSKSYQFIIFLFIFPPKVDYISPNVRRQIIQTLANWLPLWSRFLHIVTAIRFVEN